MLEHAQDLIRRAGTALEWNVEQIERLLKLDHEHSATLEVGEESYQAFRMQHSNKRGPYKGGIRFHPEVDDDEVRALATLMSIKTAATNIPMGGGKGGVIVDPKTKSPEELEAIARGYVRAFHEHLGPEKDVPAPDVNTDGETIDWMVDEYSKLTGDTSRASFTGKSMNGGGSEGRVEATGRGGVIALREYCKVNQLDPTRLRVAVQGIGNVGFYFAQIAQKELGITVAALSNSRHTYISKNGFDLGGKEFSRDIGEVFAREADEVLSADAILSAEVEVLVLAALGDVVNTDNHATIKASVIVELANGPLSTEALDLLESRNVAVIPDVIANAGGVIVSYLEWKQNRAGEHWTETEVNAELDRLLSAAMQEMFDTAAQYKTDLSVGAYITALQRLV